MALLLRGLQQQKTHFSSRRSDTASDSYRHQANTHDCQETVAITLRPDLDKGPWYKEMLPPSPFVLKDQLITSLFSLGFKIAPPMSNTYIPAYIPRREIFLMSITLLKPKHSFPWILLLITLQIFLSKYK